MRLMPVITSKMSKKMAKAGFRPNCSVCGRLCGIGGWYGIIEVDSGVYEEYDSLCKKHSKVVLCEDCGGSGYHLSDTPDGYNACRACEGWGYVPKRQEVVENEL